MLTIVIPTMELFIEQTSEFISIPQTTLRLEHSLISISKWERKWHKAYLKKEQKSYEENIDYIRCMTITQNVNPSVYYALTTDNLISINKYINDPMTAVWFPKEDATPNTEADVLTNEVIYYTMIKLGIPMEFEKIHLNALLALIKVFEIKDAPKKKLSQAEINQRHRAIKKANRAKRRKV
nr:MAG TPA: hypothetical protein [Caudoviricetes sp.]